MTLADVLRLVAVPVLGWAAYRDVQVRRVPTRTWYPLVALGAVLLAWDAWRLFGGEATYNDVARRLFLLRVAVSLGVVAPFAYLVWRVGGFGGADAKALIALAVLFPTYPTFVLDLPAAGTTVLPHPAGVTAIGVFSLTVLTNTVLLGVAYPVALAARNLVGGDVARVMLVGRRVPAASTVRRHGSLLETPEGYTRSGLDVDALRMYLRWRGTTLEALRAAPDRHRDPASLPAEPNDPGDGAIDAAPREPARPDAASSDAADPDAERAAAPGERSVTESEEAATGESPAGDAPAGGDPADDAPTGEPPSGVSPDDDWGAAAFLDDVGWGAYGTDPDDLRAGLEVLVARDEVWYSPGIPFIVPMFAGLLVALTVGDLLYLALQWLSLV